jgi:hypothetical protein
MEKLASNKFVYIILAAIIIIAVSILMLSGDKKDSKTVIPNAENTDSLTEEQMLSIKNQYEQEGNMEEFEDVFNNIEQAVAAKFLDGTITSYEQLKLEIDKVNKMFKSSDWDYLNIIYPSFWMGTWSLDSKGKLYFTFANKSLTPDWVKDIEMKDYVK